MGTAGAGGGLDGEPVVADACERAHDRALAEGANLDLGRGGHEHGG
jgi:hypothetical protein